MTIKPKPRKYQPPEPEPKRRRRQRRPRIDPNLVGIDPNDRAARWLRAVENNNKARARKP